MIQPTLGSPVVPDVYRIYSGSVAEIGTQSVNLECAISKS